VLVTFYQHSYEDHIESLRPGGVLLYDNDHVKPTPTTNASRHRRARHQPHHRAVGGAAKDKGKNIFVLGLLARIFQLDVAKLTGSSRNASAAARKTWCATPARLRRGLRLSG